MSATARPLNTEGTTPTQDLLLGMLLTRYRLGETLWTFDSRHRAAIDDLAARGIVTPLNGIVPKSVRAALTDAAIQHYLHDPDLRYIAPLALIHHRNVRLDECAECRRPFPCKTREMADPKITLTDADR